MSREAIGYQYAGVGFFFLVIGGIHGILPHDLRGTVIVFFAIIPIVFAALGTFIVPLQPGTQMALPRLFAFSVILYEISAVLLVLDALGVEPAGIAVVMIFNSLSVILCSVSFIAAILRLQRHTGWLQLSFLVWSLFLTAIILILEHSLLGIASTFRVVSYFTGSAGFLLGEGLHHSGGPGSDLWYHVFWLAGHPEVFVLGLLLLAAVADSGRTVIRLASKPRHP